MNRRNKRALDARQKAKQRRDAINRASRGCHNDGRTVGNRTSIQSREKHTTAGKDTNESSSAKCTPRKSFIFQSKSSSPAWDSYCKDDSCHQFSAEEKQARIQNKNNYLSFLRSEASKRKAKVEIEKRLQAELEQESGNSVVKSNDMAMKTNTLKRKPPVPRLSRQGRLGLSEISHSKLAKKDVPTYKGKSQSSSDALRLEIKGNKATTTRKECNPPIKSKDQKKSPTRHTQSEKNCNKSPKPPKISYLDFISKKPGKIAQSPQAGSPSPKATKNVTKQFRQHQEGIKLESQVKHEASSLDPSAEGDDDSKFRNQIERIVERAAEMVLKERHIIDKTKCKDAIAIPADTSKQSDSAVEVETVSTSPETGFKQSSDNSSSSTSTFLQFNAEDLQRRLSILEDRVKNVSSPKHRLMKFENKSEEKSGLALQCHPIVKRSPPADSPVNNGDDITSDTSCRRDPSSDASTISEVTTDFHLIHNRYTNFHRTDKGDQSLTTESCSSNSKHISDGDSSTEVFPRLQVQPMHLPSRLHTAGYHTLSQIDEGTSFSSFPTELFDGSDQKQMKYGMSAAMDTKRSNGAFSYQHSLSYSEDSLSDFFPRNQVVPTNFPEHKLSFSQIESHQPLTVQPDPNAGLMSPTEFIVEDDDEPPMPRGYEMQQNQRMCCLQHDNEAFDDDLFSLLG